MKSLYRTILLSTICVWSGSSFAGTWVQNQSIQYLYAGEVGGRIAVKLSGISPNPDSCSSASDLIVEDSNTKIKEIWSLLLAAHMANRKVSVYLAGCGTGTYKFPIIKDIKVGSS